MPESAVSASSVHVTCSLRYYRLNQPTGAWCAVTDNLNQWIGVDVGE